MPITQDRMLALIHCARQCYDNWRDLRGYIRERGQDVLLGKLTEAEAYREINSYVTHLQLDPEVARALGAEERNFTHSAQHRNRRNAAAMRRRRHGSVAEDDFAPTLPKVETKVSAAANDPPPCGNPSACNMPTYKGQCVTCGHRRAEATTTITPDGEHYVIKGEKTLEPSDLAGGVDLFAGDPADDTPSGS